METGDDCHFYYNSTCAKGDKCMFRHVLEAKLADATCESWRRGSCLQPKCPYRHIELDYQRPACYFETQPGGCTKLRCQFQHKFPGNTNVTATSGPPTRHVTAQPVQGVQQNWPPQRYPAVPTNAWAVGAVSQSGLPYPTPRPEFRPFHGPHTPVVPRAVGYMLDQSGVNMLQVEPIIINPNEESDIEGSPIKRVIAPPTSSAATTKTENPLDYFLNAKPFIDPNPPRSRSPSPSGRISPYRRPRSSVSPVRRSPRRSLSPVGNRRSTSMERYESGLRRRSGSLDRSRSPEWRDKRRLVPRSRSPPGRRSRSPGRDRLRGPVHDNLSRYKPGDLRGPKFEEIRVSGPKIVSLKKGKKDKKENDTGIQNKEDTKVDTDQEERSNADVVKEEVKSLEEIYRERALLSMMEAKRKKILEAKKKRWESIQRKSESEKSDQSDKLESQVTVDEKGDNSDKGSNAEEDSSSDSKEEDEESSDIDFNADVDIELGEGELEIEGEKDIASGTEESQKDKEESPQRPSRQSKHKHVKPNIKSRLGLKAVEDVAKQADRTQSYGNPAKGSVKDRLGLKTSESGDRPLQSGVIRLNRPKKSDDIFSRIQINRDLRGVRKLETSSKNILMVPQITIKNKYEDRKTSIKQRLGLLDDDENDLDSRKSRKKKSLDEELMKLLEDEETDIELEDLELLTKKEKKKLLKKLLAQQGREDEYELFSKKRKKKGVKKRRGRDIREDDGYGREKRKINISGTLGPHKETEESHDYDEGEDMYEDELHSGDEIQLEEREPDTDGKENASEGSLKDAVEGSKEAVDEMKEADHFVLDKTMEEIKQEKVEKAARLREALEPKSLDDIRRERAAKKSQGEDVRIQTDQHRRKIVIADEENITDKPKPEPEVRVTFGGSDLTYAPKRKLLRLGGNPDNTGSIQITSTRTKKERQIYIPPSKKEEPVRKAVDPTKGRDIVDYSDMFSKKPTTDITVKKITTKVPLPPATTKSRQPLKLQKGPPKVEVKDATVKTFAEIMAEKKRKRQLAQQGTKKAFNPITFDDTESSNSQPPQQECTKDRLSPVYPPSISSSQLEISSNLPSSPAESDLKSISLKKTASSDISFDSKASKPISWKRRKINEQKRSPSQDSDQLKADIQKVDTNEIVSDIKSKVPVLGLDKKEKQMKKTDKLLTKQFVEENLTESGFQEPETDTSLATKRRTSDEPTGSTPVAEKKAKLSDSLLDFDDDLLNMDDDDLDLDTNKDHDELMREIDELLN